MRGGMTRKVISAILTIAMTVGAVPTDGIAYALAAGADAGGAAAASAQPTDANNGGASDLGGASALAEDLKTATENAFRTSEAGVAPVADIATTAADATDAQEEPQRVKVRLDANGGEGEASETEVVLDGNVWTMPENPFSREGYQFVGWNTTADGKDVTDDPATEGDEALAAIAVADRQEAVNLKITVQTEDGAVVEHDLGECVRDGSLTLYAQWEKVDAGKETDEVGTPAASEDVPATTDTAATADNALSPATGTEQGGKEEKGSAAEDTETKTNTGSTLSSTLDSSLGGTMDLTSETAKTSPLARKLAAPLMAPAMGSLTTQSTPTGSREGTAYAVITNGELVFFRSTDTYQYNKIYQTMTDIMGNSYTGQIYTNVENTGSSSADVPWNKDCTSIKAVRIADGQVIAPTSCAWWFSDCYNLKAFIGFERLDTSNVTSMSRMFYNCASANLTLPDTSHWDTSKVTDMSNMFDGCGTYGTDLTPPDMSGWDTSNVTNMSEMFLYCAMTELDISHLSFSSISSESNYLGVPNPMNLKKLKVSSESKIAGLSDHPAKDSYLTTWKNTSLGVTGATAADVTAAVNAGNGAGMWEWERDGNYLSFDPNGGTGFMDDVKIEDGTLVPTCRFTAPSGMMFASLNTASDGSGSPYMTGDPVPKGADMTLYAQWETDPKSGSAYAVLDDQGTLTFFRSEESVTPGENQTATDIMGNTHTGRIYANVEETGTALSSIPWHEQAGNIYVAKIADGQTIAPKCCASWFAGCTKMTAFVNAENLDLSETTSLSSMFSYCMSPYFIAPNLSGWDTSNVADMSYMFYNCTGAGFSELDVSGWDFSKVTSPLGLHGCANLRKITLPAGAKITGLPEHTAQGDYAVTWGNAECGITGSTAANMVTTINAGNGAGTWTWEFEGMAYAVLDSGASTDSPGTLHFIRSTESVGNGTVGTITAIDGKSYTGTIYARFEESETVSDAPWHANSSAVSKVTFENAVRPKTTAKWFNNFTKATSFENLERLDMSQNTNMGWMFEHCDSLTEFTAPWAWDTSNVTDMSYMFGGCASLATLNLNQLDTSAVTSMFSMCSSCYSLREVTMTGCDTSSVTNMSFMFDDCSALESVLTGGQTPSGKSVALVTPSVTNTSRMFAYCTSLTWIKGHEAWDTSNVTNMSCMFRGCTSLQSLDTTNWSPTSATDMNSMFYDCAALNIITLGTWVTRDDVDLRYMFLNCAMLHDLDLRGFHSSDTIDLPKGILHVTIPPNLKTSIPPGAVQHSWKETVTSSEPNGFTTEYTNGPVMSKAEVDNILKTGSTDGNTHSYGVCDMRAVRNGTEVTFVRTDWSTTSLDKLFGTLDSGAWENGTVTDLDGNTYTGTVCEVLEYAYRGYEQDATFDVSTVKSVKFTGGYAPYALNWQFTGMSSLETIDWGDFDGSRLASNKPRLASYIILRARSYINMFKGCTSLKTVDVSRIAGMTGNATSFANTFNGCSSLESLDLTGWNTTAATNMGGMFDGMTSLTSVTLDSTFSFKGKGITDEAKMAVLPTPSGALHTGKWVSPDGTQTLTAAELRDSYDGSTMSGTWTAETDSMAGAAYAVLDSGASTDSPGTLHFIRSTESVGNGTVGTITAIDGKSYTGTIYAGFEDLEESGNTTSKKPWSDNSSAVSKVAFENKVRPKTTGQWFYGFAKVTSFENLDRLDTSRVTEMGYMFWGCKSLTEFTVPAAWDTSNVTSMALMFEACEALTTIVVGHLDTSNVTNMWRMFSACSSLRTLPDMSHWDTSKVTNMGFMFSGCTGLTDIDELQLNTSNVTDMSAMFENCTSLATLNVGGWDVRKVEDMGFMFNNCQNLTSINLSGWETDSLTSIGGLFQYCTKLTYVDMRGFDTTKCPSTARIIPPNALCITVGPKFVEEHNTNNLSKHRSWRQMETPASATTEPTVYVGTETLLKNDVSKLFAQTDRDGIVTYGTCDMEAVKSGTEITFARVGWQATRDDALAMEAAGTTSITGTFTDLNGKQHTGTRAPVLETAAASAFPSDWDVSSITAVKFEGGYKPQFLNWQFKGMSSLTSIDWGDFSGEWLTTGTLGKSRAYRSAFEGCSSLRTLDVSRIAGMTGNATFFDNTFKDCSSLESLDLTGWNTGAATNMSGMFDGMTSLTSVALDGSFSFKGNGITDEAKMAVLPTPTGDDYTGKWVSPNRTQTLMAAELRDSYDGSTMFGAWTAEHTPTAGSAYAVFDGTTGTLTLLRSMEQHDNMTNGTVVDIRGNSYTGTIFAGLEEDGTTGTANQKWLGFRENITGARVAANQTIRPKNCAYWFANCKNMTSLSLEGLDTSTTTNMRDVFQGCAALTSLDVSGLDTSHVTDMRYMFSGCKNITSLDVSGFDTSNVTNMSNMFFNCPTMTEPLAVGNWSTSAVTDMDSMFGGCASLTTAPDTSKWDTSKVTDMSYLFYGCTGLTDIDASGLDMASVTDMSGMFEECSNLVTANTSGWDTSSATSMAWAFHGCGKIEELDIASWSTAAATDMEDMFDGMGSLRHIDLGPQFSFKGNGITDEAKMAVLPTPTGDDYTGKWVSPNVTGALAATELRDAYAGASMAGVWIAEGTARAGDAYAALDGSGNLTFFRSTDGIRYENGVATIIDVKGNKYENRVFAGIETNTGRSWANNSVKTARVADGQVIAPVGCNQWFPNCMNMISCNLEGLDVSKIEDMSSMFYNCKKLGFLTLPSDWDTSAVTNMSKMFYGCSSLTELAIPASWDTSKVTDVGGMFRGCSGLTSLDISHLDTRKATNMYDMFRGCSGLTSLDISHLDTSSVAGSMGYMFFNCKSLTELAIPASWDTSNVEDMSYMFSHCSGLRSLDLGGLETDNVKNMKSMLSDCSSLTELAVPASWDTSNVENMSLMFYNCAGLTTLDLAALDTSSATDMSKALKGCSSLTSVVLGPKFSFKGNGITSETSMAMLPTPKVNETYDGKWSRSDGRFLSTPAELRDSYDGTTMAGTYAVHEYTGTITPINPDDNVDGLGDNLSFSVPTSVNFVLDRDGSLTAPTNAAIENHSGSGLLVTSAKAEEQGGFALVEEISETGGNQAAIKFGAGTANLSASDYLTKKALSGAAWHAAAAGSVGLSFEGRVKTDGVDVARVTPFGRITWYVTAAETPTGDGA